MFILLTNRFHTKWAEGEKVLINADNIVSIRGGAKGTYLQLQAEILPEFLAKESLEEICQLLAGGVAK